MIEYLTPGELRERSYQIKTDKTQLYLVSPMESFISEFFIFESMNYIPRISTLFTTTM